jgi:hypothetical protein
MSSRILSFVALAVSMLYGAGFAALEPTPRGYAAVGGAVVALSWIAVGTFGKDDEDDPEPKDEPEDEPPVDPFSPYGTPPADRR